MDVIVATLPPNEAEDERDLEIAHLPLAEVDKGLFVKEDALSQCLSELI